MAVLRRALALALAFVLPACFSPSIADGQIECSPEGDCPPGFQCGADNRCHNGDVVVDASGSGGDGNGAVDAPHGGGDGGTVDAPSGEDGGMAGGDGGMAGGDGGMTDVDGGTGTADAGTGTADAGTGPDAGPPLSAPPTILQCTSGGGLSTSPTYELTLSVGQTVVGPSVGGGVQVNWGLLPMSQVP